MQKETNNLILNIDAIKSFLHTK